MIFEKKIGGADSAPPPNVSNPEKQPNVTRVKMIKVHNNILLTCINIPSCMIDRVLKIKMHVIMYM